MAVISKFTNREITLTTVVQISWNLDWAVSGVVWRKSSTRFLIFWFFAIFWAPKNAESAKIAKKWRFSDFTRPKNREKLKYQKSGRWFSSNYLWEYMYRILAHLDQATWSYFDFYAFFECEKSPYSARPHKCRLPHKRRFLVFPNVCRIDRYLP